MHREFAMMNRRIISSAVERRDKSIIVIIIFAIIAMAMIIIIIIIIISLPVTKNWSRRVCMWRWLIFAHESASAETD